jgi:hypothetical protein
MLDAGHDRGRHDERRRYLLGFRVLPGIDALIYAWIAL